MLGLDVKNHIAGHTRSIFRTLWLSLIALKTIKNSGNKLVIVWQGYGTYAVLASALLGRKTRFILNTYKVPSDRPQALKKRINDKLLGKAISAADAVITISRAQANALKSYNPNVVWIPFASDSSWWTPGFPDHALLASHGIGYRDYILIMGDVDRDERTTLKAVRDLNHPILRVTREPRTALGRAAGISGIKHYAGGCSCERSVRVAARAIPRRTCRRGSREKQHTSRRHDFP